MDIEFEGASEAPTTLEAFMDVFAAQRSAEIAIEALATAESGQVIAPTTTEEPQPRLASPPIPAEVVVVNDYCFRQPASQGAIAWASLRFAVAALLMGAAPAACLAVDIGERPKVVGAMLGAAVFIAAWLWRDRRRFL